MNVLSTFFSVISGGARVFGFDERFKGRWCDCSYQASHEGTLKNNVASCRSARRACKCRLNTFFHILEFCLSSVYSVFLYRKKTSHKKICVGLLTWLATRWTGNKLFFFRVARGSPACEVNMQTALCYD